MLLWAKCSVMHWSFQKLLQPETLFWRRNVPLFQRKNYLLHILIISRPIVTHLSGNLPDFRSEEGIRLPLAGGHGLTRSLSVHSRFTKTSLSRKTILRNIKPDQWSLTCSRQGSTGGCFFCSLTESDCSNCTWTHPVWLRSNCPSITMTPVITRSGPHTSGPDWTVAP